MPLVIQQNKANKTINISRARIEHRKYKSSYQENIKRQLTNKEIIMIISGSKV
jgi:hypothetical protein